MIYRTWNVYRLPKQVVFLFTLYSISYNNIINNSNNNNNNSNSNNTIIVIISVTSTYVLFNSGITVQKGLTCRCLHVCMSVCVCCITSIYIYRCGGCAKIMGPGQTCKNSPCHKKSKSPLPFCNLGVRFQDTQRQSKFGNRTSGARYLNVSSSCTHTEGITRTYTRLTLSYH